MSSSPVNKRCPQCGSHSVSITLTDQNPKMSYKSWKDYEKCKKSLMREGHYVRGGGYLDGLCPCCGGRHVRIELERVKRTCKDCGWSWYNVKEWLKSLAGFRMESGQESKRRRRR